MSDIDRSPHNKDAALVIHHHICPECGTRYTCNCSEQDRHESLVCTNCEREAS
jgi:hypothetical protein